MNCLRFGALLLLLYLLTPFSTAFAGDKPKQQVVGDIVCASGEVLKHDGEEWVCGPDNDSPTTSLDWTSITSRPAGLDDGDDDSDTLAELSCGPGEVAKSNGSGGWNCAPDDTGVPSTDTLAELDCDAGDVARFNGTAWECSDAVSKLELLTYGKRVFLSSATFSGNFGGLEGADASCQQLAGAVGLPGRFRAWLSDSTGSPATRFTLSDSPYILVDGTIVANDWVDLTDGSIEVMINRDESGVEYPVSTFPFGDQVWSNTKEDGTTLLGSGSFNCQHWTSAGTDLGLIGSHSSTETPSAATEVFSGSGTVRLGWSRMQSLLTLGGSEFGEAFRSCDAAVRIYCFQQ